MIVRYFQIFSLALVVLTCKALWAQSSVQVNISEFEDTTHLELSGLRNWNYDIEKKGDQELRLLVPALSVEAAGTLSAYKDGYIENIEVKKLGLQSEVIFKLKKQDIEHFDYMTDEPSLLIVDFYKKAVEEKKADQPKKKSKSSRSKPIAKKSSEYSKISREPASGEILVVEKEDPSASLERKFGAFDSSDEDFGRFQIKDYEIKESSVIASKQNIYLQFPPLIMPVSRLDHWVSQQPEYVIKPGEDRETKEAILLHTLYMRERENVFLKTYDYFTNKYPDSKYHEILENLAADIYLKRWIKGGVNSDYNQVKNRLSDLIERYPESPLTKRNQYILAYANLERGEALPSLESIQKLLQLYPDSEEAPFLKMAQAEALMDLKKYDDARAVYQKVIADYPNTNFSAQANYRLGDVSMRSDNWKEAADQYLKSLNGLKENKSDYPNAHFNRGEALFWQEKYRESVEEFAQFLKSFPTHPYGSYAMTRIGELFDILGANTQRVMGAYLESYFRYPNLPGSKLARIRLLSQKMKSMKPKAFESAIAEIKELQKEIKIKDINEFVTLLVADGYKERGDYMEALHILSEFYQKHPNSKHQDVIRKQIRRNIANEMERKIDGNDYLGALDFYEKYNRTWLQGSDRIDIEYFKGKAFELAGALGEASKIYSHVEKRLEKIQGTQEEKEKRVHEKLPSLDEVHLRLAAVFNDQREYVKSYKTLKKIKNADQLEGKNKVERTQLMADLWIQRGDYPDASQALDILIKDYQGNKLQLAPALVNQAQVKNHLKKWEEALTHANKALEIGEASPNLRSQAYAEKVKAQLNLNLKASAIQTLQAQLDEFEGKSPTEYIRYKLGELLFQEGDVAAAEGVWERLKESKSNVLWKIAEEKLKSAQFEKNYSRYIDRIPAMSSQGGNVEESQ